MKILALDLGQHTGWAAGVSGAITSLGTEHWVLPKAATQQRMDRRCDPRFLRFHDWLFNAQFQNKFDWIVFEDVQFAQYRMQAHLWASWRSAVWLMSKHGAQIDCVPTNVLKQFAGSGNADKEFMARALVRADSRFTLDGKRVRDNVGGVLIDDNAVDAVWLLKWAQKTFR